jgi:hypothetical protein
MRVESACNGLPSLANDVEGQTDSTNRLEAFTAKSNSSTGTGPDPPTWNTRTCAMRSLAPMPEPSERLTGIAGIRSYEAPGEYEGASGRGVRGLRNNYGHRC